MSGRPRSIDREKLLDAAEAIIASEGAAGLSFGALAKAAGVTRGGVQYAFGNKDNLIRAMVDRWADSFETDVMGGLGPDPSPKAVIQSHIRANLAEGAEDFARSAMMMTAIFQNPDQVADTRAWYDSRLAGLDLSRPEDRDAAIAFLASEGVFFLKSFGLTGLDDAAWQQIFAGISRLAEGAEGAGRAGGSEKPDR